eukprot:TRINITY_DN60882_c0_g1_i1.p1 TRINITY_DN60882_c0_g1~~TRINITY_DN60882_c0_g1_i1.p1  ORF type:complete len:249 (-),score=27.60 TRINITY_DN60882_c0_g1_i1:29-775(-)
MPTRDEGGFIRPTQGLTIRRSGGLMQTNLENIGGRILYMEEMNGHKNRMKAIKPVVQLQPPWGHDAEPAKTKRSGATSSAPPKRKTRKASADADVRVQPSPHGAPSSPAAAVREFDISILNAEHQQLYHDFVRMLCLMGNEDSRAILEQAYRESEEKKLLSGYTGIFPTLDNEDEDDEEDDDDLEDTRGNGRDGTDAQRPVSRQSTQSRQTDRSQTTFSTHTSRTPDSAPHSRTVTSQSRQSPSPTPD